MKKRISVILLMSFCLISLMCKAESRLMLTPQTNEVIPPAPASAQQMRYQSPQPSLATGAVSLSIPLYTIEAEGVSIPFTLSYQTSGIKPFDDPFPCGYGWSLQPALRITRTIRGRCDEMWDYIGDNPGELLDPEKAFAAVIQKDPGELSGKNTSLRYDTEKDIFTVSLPSGTTNRVIIKNGNGWDFIGGGDDNETVITGNGDLSEIKAVDAAGIVYKFGTPCESLLNGSQVAARRTSWSLKSICLPSGREITFGWTSFNHDPIYVLGGMAARDEYSSVDAANTMSFLWTDDPPEQFFQNEGYYKKRVHLSSVTFPGGRLAFGYTAKRLTEVSVINSAGDSIKSFSLSYGTGTTDSNLLKSVISSLEGVYTFEYNPLWTDMNRLKQDWWGYYNGRENPMPAPPLTPRLRIMSSLHIMTPPAPQTIGYADMTPDADAMKAGLLTKVTYPTGGNSEFSYEPHSFPPTRVSSGGNITDDTDPYLSFGGGLRVRSITTRHSPDDANPHVRTYEYDSVVVTAVPSAATFVSISWGFTFYNAETLFPCSYTYRIVNVAHQSDYMKNHIGEDAIWYRKVTEVYPEGKTEFLFNRTLPASQENRSWGFLSPYRLNNVFSKGARLVGERVWKTGANGDPIIVSQSRYAYEAVTQDKHVSNGSLVCTQVSRKYIQSGINTSEAPDFSNGRYIYYQYYDPNATLLGGDFRHVTADYFDIYPPDSTPYGIDPYELMFCSDRLRSKTVTRHLENGDLTQTETYEYKPGTSIITSVTTTTPGDGRTNRVDLAYASPSGTAAEKEMYAANITGVPVKTTQTFGSSATTVRHEMARYGTRLYLPSKTYQIRGADSLLVGQYDYDSFGNLREHRGQDGIPTAYFWGYGGLHPVYAVRGAGYSQIAALNPGANALGGSAELTDLTSMLGGWLMTKALWKPLVGVTSQREPHGLTTTYNYDSAGRLVKTAIDGHGPVAGYTYHINEGGKNYHTSGIYTRAGASGAFVREIINYDGLGRESSRLTKSIHDVLIKVERLLPLDPSEPTDPAYYGVLTEYDAMDRPCRQWAAAPCSERNPSTLDIASAAEDFYGTPYAYVTTLYEPSPAGTVTGRINSGTPWHENDRRKTVRHLVNTLSGDYSCHRLTLNGTSLSRSPYQKGALLVEEATDEEGHVAMTFTDCRGKTVMTREGSPGDWHDTRYVYNDYGDLLAVLQPMSDPAKTSVQSEWAFTYRYDAHGRCVGKTVPGAMAVSYVYDSGGRLFAEQDGEMLSRGEWLLHFYDRFGREAFSSVTTATSSQVAAASKSVYTATPPAAGADIANTRGGYTVGDNFPLTLASLDRALYYDNYNFKGACKWITTAAPSPLSSAAASRTDVTGLQTGAYSEGRVSVTYYDGLARPYATLEGAYSLPYPGYGIAASYNYEGAKQTESQWSFAPTRERMQKTDYSYYTNGMLQAVTVTQGTDTATIAYGYDRAGRLNDVTYAGRLRRQMAYDVHGWLKSVSVIDPYGISTFALRPGQLAGETLHSETLYYADAPSGAAARFDGKIAGRQANGDLTAYAYDIHGRLTASQSVTMKDIAGEVGRDYSTSYSYDKNANLTSLTRMGVSDVIHGGQTRLFGLQNQLQMSYTGNQLRGMTVAGQGADYEGRTGLGTAVPGSRLAYDANGNLRVDETRNIVRINYNRRNLPTEITFGDGHRQTVTYDGSGRKLRVDYSQVPEAMLRGGMEIYSDNLYELSSTREYVGPYVFTDGRLEYSAFAGGYFDPAKGAMYYITDWQGNNVAVVGKDGAVEQQTIYYPYGEPTVEPTGQRYLFAGKEREHAGGRNTYDFGARSLTPYGRWGVVDQLAEKFYPFSPYSYCGGDPINRVDSNGMEWRVKKSEDGKTINFHITGAVINTSSKEFDLNKVATAIENQLKEVYTFSNDDISVTMSADIRSVTSADDIKSTDHVFRIQEQSHFEKGTLATATTPGLDIRLGTKVIEETLTGGNNRTIAHEVGHSGGLHDSNLTRNTIPIENINSNLMTQTVGLGTGYDKNKATVIQTNQINSIVQMYNDNKLNKNSPLRKQYNPQLHTTWPFVTITSKYLCR